MQDLLQMAAAAIEPSQRKTASEAQRPARASTDADNQGSGWDPASDRLEYRCQWKPHLVRSRLIILHQKAPDGYRNRDPRRNHQ